MQETTGPGWLEQYPEWVPRHLEYPEIPLPELLAGAAAAWPDRVATQFYGARLSYRELWRQAQAFAGALAALGLSPGERVALLLPNCPQAVIAFYGTLLAGGVVVWTNPLYTERELQHQLADSGAVVLVGLDLLWPRIARVRPALGLRHVVVTSIKDYLPFPLSVLYPLKQRRDGAPLPAVHGEGVHHWRDLLRAGQAPPALPAPDVHRDIALLQYTGGTTGLAKGAMLSHFNLIANMTQVRAWVGSRITLPARILCVMPFFHVYGLTICLNFAVATGSTMLLMPKWAAHDALKLIEQARPTVFPGTPALYVALANHPRIHESNLRSIELCISGAAPLPAEVETAFVAATGATMIEGYGLTEASPVTHVTPIGAPRVLGSIGLPLPDVEFRLADPDGGEAEVAPGAAGELLVRGPGVMLGYWGRPEETAAVLADGWLRTGDIVRLDERGYAYVVDRKKDMIIVSGFKVFPREVEEVLHEHPAVLEAAVAGPPDPRRGQVVKAYVVLRDGAQATEAEIIAFCRERLAPFKAPHAVEFRTDLPKSLIGKVLRRALLAEEAERAQAGAPVGGAGCP